MKPQGGKLQKCSKSQMLWRGRDGHNKVDEKKMDGIEDNLQEIKYHEYQDDSHHAEMAQWMKEQ